ncbi:MAG: tetraacyldisaccharide 4'-kinase [Magnetococcus sp. WYHC-3]
MADFGKDWQGVLTASRSGTPLEMTLLQTLRPLGWMHGVWQSARAAGYERGLFPIWTPPVPTIAVGNLTAGGTGKTPTALWLLESLLAQGRRPALVSRGYRPGHQATLTVVSDGIHAPLSYPHAGDEAVLVARRLPHCVVVTGPNRRDAVEWAVHTLGADSVVLDDAFQHLRVGRHLNLALLDARRPLGNGRLLPAGYLRERPSALARADLFLLTRADAPSHEQRARAWLEQSFPGRPVLACRHRPRGWRSQDGTSLAVEALAGQPLVAFAGLAQPEQFFHMVAQCGGKLVARFPLPDHVSPDPALWQIMESAVRQHHAVGVVCTEKDRVKLPAAVPCCPLWSLEMTLQFQDGSGVLDTALQRILSPSAPAG